MKLQTEFDNYDWWEEDEEGGEGSAADKSADDINVIKKSKDSSNHSLPRSRPPTRPPTREEIIERMHHTLHSPVPTAATTSHYITAAAVTEADEDNESDNTAAVTTSPAAVSVVTSSPNTPAARIESADSQHSGSSVHGGSEPSTSSQEDLRYLNIFWRAIFPAFLLNYAIKIFECK